MAWTAPKTYSASEILTAANMNTYQRDNSRWLSHNATGGAPMCRVYDSNGTNLSTGAETTVEFDSERFDPNGMHDPSTNNSRITIPTGGDGKYLIGANVLINATAAGDRYVRLREGGSTYWASNQAPGSNQAAGGDDEMSIVSLVDMAAADYMEVRAYTETAASLNPGGNYSPEFWAIWVGE